MFEQLLSCAGTVSHGTLKYPKVDDVAESAFSGEIKRVYQSLGGIRPSIPLNLLPWDMEFGGIAVELDEYLHFNRYRSITLNSTNYIHLPRFPTDDYQRYCSEHENMCLKVGRWGKRWSSTSCEAQFGDASQPGDLSGNGSPRWKQRAFYDFVKDLSRLLTDVTVVRVALWDIVMDGDRVRTVEEVLFAPFGRTSSAALAGLVMGRAAD